MVKIARLLTCKGCNKKISANEKYTHSSKTYCKECYDKKVRESNEYKQLIEFICTHYGIDRPTGFMLKQIKNYKDQYSYNYAAMTYTLWYCKEVLGKELSAKYGVSLIEHYYNDAKKFYVQQEEREKRMKSLGNIELKTKTIKLNNNQKNNNSKSALLNLDDLLKGSD